jgi:hypothetical protein
MVVCRRQRSKQWVWLAMDAETRHVGAIWNLIHDYNRLVRDKMMERGDQDILSIAY